MKSKYLFNIRQEEHPNQLRKIDCVKNFLKKLASLPFSLFHKLAKTFLRIVALILALTLLVVTFGASTTVREVFVERISILAEDIADWVLLPFALVSRLIRLIVALCAGPHIYFNFKL